MDSPDWYANLGNDPGNQLNPLGLTAQSPESDGNVGFTGSKIQTNFVSASFVGKLSYAAGVVDEYSDGQLVDSYEVVVTSIGIETNAGAEVGHTWSTYPNATKSDILGVSVSGEAQWGWGGNATVGGDMTSTGKSSIDVSASAGLSALPVSVSADLNVTRESTYDYEQAVKNLHSSEELDSWIFP